MIANHDWSMRAGAAGKDCCHNARDHRHAHPGRRDPDPVRLRLFRVRRRALRGSAGANEHQQRASSASTAAIAPTMPQASAMARQFRAARPQMLAVLAQTPGLEPRTQQRAASFLNGFFTDIATDADVSAKVLKRCVR